MANNRIHLVCTFCRAGNEQKDAVLICKYYPTTGWYSSDNIEERLTEFFIKHSHKDLLTNTPSLMWGYHITAIRETGPDEPKN